jgi:hypothetical protein
MMAQPFLKPGVLGPRPNVVWKIVAILETAVRFTLQQDELPATCPIFVKPNFCKEPFDQFREPIYEVSRQKTRQR